MRKIGRNTVQTTISIPNDLRARMDAFEEGDINWSALACEAFERRLTEDPEPEITPQDVEITLRLHVRLPQGAAINMVEEIKP